MRVFHAQTDRFDELEALPPALPEGGFVWIGVSRDEFEVRLTEIQTALQHWTGATLLELHVSDLKNRQLPSHFDYTSTYDLLVFRRLLAPPQAEAAGDEQRPIGAIETSPVGFALFDRVLLTVHSADCAVRDHFAQRLASLAAVNGETRALSRLPAGPAELMLRMVNHMVDGYLDLRRHLTREFGRLQQVLLNPKSRFTDWHLLLDSRVALHLLEDVCEDQHGAVQEWIDALDEWPEPVDDAERREREGLRVRSRDVLEHVERVLAHVGRVERSAEAAVQMHFSALGHRTNNIMRTLTVLTAIFLPLNLITGFFGMNFDSLPLIHAPTGIWITIGVMLMVGVGLGLYFWRRRFLAAS